MCCALTLVLYWTRKYIALVYVLFYVSHCHLEATKLKRVMRQRNGAITRLPDNNIRYRAANIMTRRRKYINGIINLDIINV